MGLSVSFLHCIPQAYICQQDKYTKNHGSIICLFVTFYELSTALQAESTFEAIGRQVAAP